MRRLGYIGQAEGETFKAAGADGVIRVYKLENGKFRYMIGFDLFYGISVESLPVYPYLFVPEGPVIPPPDGIIIKGQGSPEVYWMEGGKKRLFPDLETFQRANLSEGDIRVFDQNDVNMIPTGEPYRSHRSWTTPPTLPSTPTLYAPSPSTSPSSLFPSQLNISQYIPYIAIGFIAIILISVLKKK